MATTPTRSFKRTLAGTVEDRSPRFLLGSLALAMVISLLAGLGIGIKVEQHRIKTKKATAVAVVKPKKRTAKRGSVSAALLARAPVKGMVFSLGPKLLVVAGPRGRARLVMAPKTRIEVVGPGAAGDIVVGSHVLFVLAKKTAAAATGATGSSSSGATGTPAAAGTAAAKEIVVVSDNGQKSRLGTVVTAVTADSMTLKGVGGKLVTMSTVGAKIEKTAPGKRTSLVKGTRVIVRPYQAPAVRRKVKGKKARVVKSPRVALEVIVLPSGTAFA